MKKNFAQLQRIDHDHPITKETDYEFLCHLQKALLLALEECGRINVLQYRHAEEKLNLQRQERTRKLQRQRECL